MKPTFALTLSHESIGLLHRTPNGWLSIGTVATDDPDLAGALEYLRGAALGLEPQGFATKVVIPNSEILYDTVRAPGPKPAQRRAQIAAAIEGRTPYTLDELAFDWSGTGELVQVAVVARETLAEAEAFATEHRFNPVSFVAMPEPGGFAAEPWFGLTTCAPELLAPGEKVVRDQDPIRLARRGSAGKTQAAVATPEPSEGIDAPLPEVEALPEPPAPAPDETAARPASDATESQPVADPVPETAPTATTDPAPPAPQDAADLGAASEPAPETVVAEPAPKPVVAEAVVEGPVAEPVAPEPAPEAVAETPTEPAPAVVAELLPAPPDPAPVPDAMAVAEAEFRAPPAEPHAGAAEEPDQTLAWPGEDDAETLAQTKASLAASLAPPPVATGAAPRELVSDLPPPVAPSVQRALAAARAGREGPPPRVVQSGGTSLTEKMQKAIGKTAKVTKGKPKPPAPRPAFAPPPPPLPPSATQPHVPPATSEAEKMTVFGERRSPVGGKPRFLGLLLTAMLLLILLLVAVWAAMFLDPQQEASRPKAEAEAVAALPPAEEAPAAASADLPPDSALAADPAPVAEPEPEPVAEPTIAEAGTTEPAEPAPQVTTESAALSGSAPVTGPGAGTGIPLPQADESLSAPQRVELAAVPSGNADPAPAPPGALPAFGALYQFDAEGNILPTAEGVITPDGVRIVAGRPDRVPPPRPVATAPDPAPQPATQPVVAAPDPAPQPVVVTPAPPSPGAIAILPAASAPSLPEFQADNAAPRRRPPQRPADLVVAPAPPAPAAPEAPIADEGALPGLSPTSIAARRPAPRPASVLAAAESDRARLVAAAAAAAAASASTAIAAETPGLPATRRPAARPTDLARAAVAAAVAPTVVTERALVARPAPQPEPVAAAPAPRNTPRFGAHPDEALEDGEPEITASAPNIPTRASVARQATVTGALNLGRTNLIGVFGTSNARYALVRESGGRLVRVKVGDRVDGGRVVAIGASDLSYQRGGDTLRLTMPRS
jgi:hypothetical protein